MLISLENLKKVLSVATSIEDVYTLIDKLEFCTTTADGAEILCKFLIDRGYSRGQQHG